MHKPFHYCNWPQHIAAFTVNGKYSKKAYEVKMFESVLFLHSWFRWVVLVSLILLGFKFFKSWIKKEKWAPTDNSYINGFSQIYYTQIAIGLTLYFGLSPIPKAVISDTGLLKDPYFFFFSIRHGLSMILGVGVFHMGKAIAKKKPVESRYMILTFTVIATLLVILSAIPWPTLSYGRDFFRWF